MLEGVAARRGCGRGRRPAPARLRPRPRGPGGDDGLARALPGARRRAEHGGDGVRARGAARVPLRCSKRRTQDDARGLGGVARAAARARSRFSGSRGALAAVFTGLAVYALLVRAAGRARDARRPSRARRSRSRCSRRPRARTRRSRPGRTPHPPQVTPAPGYLDANLQGPRLQDDIGHPGVGVADTTRRERNLTGSSGRTEAWRGALGLAADRPVVGYGFGTEDRTFVDRYVFFNSNVPENSYIGILLQLGLVGLRPAAGARGRARRAGAPSGLARHRRGRDRRRSRPRSCSRSSSRTSTRPATRPRSPPGSARSRSPARRRRAREARRPRRRSSCWSRSSRSARGSANVAPTANRRGCGRCSRRSGRSTRRTCAASGSSPTSTAWSTSADATTSRSSCASTTDGRVVEAIDRRDGTAEVWSLRDDPVAVGGRRRPRRGEPAAATDERPRRVPPGRMSVAPARTAGRRDPGDAGRADRRDRAGREPHPAVEHAGLPPDAHVRAARAGGARAGVPRRHSDEAAAPSRPARDRGVHGCSRCSRRRGRPTRASPSTVRWASRRSSSRLPRSRSARSTGLAWRAS